jgi:hypothetical protein
MQSCSHHHSTTQNSSVTHKISSWLLFVINPSSALIPGHCRSVFYPYSLNFSRMSYKIGLCHTWSFRSGFFINNMHLWFIHVIFLLLNNIILYRSIIVYLSNHSFPVWSIMNKVVINMHIQIFLVII